MEAIRFQSRVVNMLKSYCFTLCILFFSCMVYAQLLDSPKSIYDNHPYFKYYDEIAKKETGKTLLQLAHDSHSDMAKGKSIVMSELEFQAINIAVDKHKKGVAESFPIRFSIYAYKIDSNILYVYIGALKKKSIWWRWV